MSSGVQSTSIVVAHPAGVPSVDSRLRPRRGGALLAAAVLLAGSLILALFFWPGHMDADALNQITEARTGRFNDWWAPVLDWLWRGLYLLHLSPGFVLWATIAVSLFSIYELLRSTLGRRSAVIGALLIAVFPPVLGFLGSLQRDTWFGASTLAAYALMVRARKTSGRQRTAAAVGSLLAIWFSLAARQNALIADLPAAVLVTAMLLGHRRPARWRRPARTGARDGSWKAYIVPIAGAAVVLGVFVLSQRVLTYDVMHATRTYPQQETLEGDLANISVRTDTVLLPASVFPSQSIKVLRTYYSPYSILPLISGSGHPVVAADPGQTTIPLTKAQESELRHDWEKAVEDHPSAYLHSRWEQWTRLVAWSGNAHEPYHPGYDPNLWGYKATLPSWDRFAQAYLSSFTSGPLMGGALHRVWVYLLVCSALAVDLLRRGRPKRLRPAGWLCGGAVVYYLSFFFLSMGQSYRWAWLLVAATMIGLCLDGADRLGRAVEVRAGRLHGLPVDPATSLATL